MSEDCTEKPILVKVFWLSFFEKAVSVILVTMMNLENLHIVRVAAMQIINEQGIVYPTPAHPNNRLTAAGQYNFPDLLLANLESGDPDKF